MDASKKLVLTPILSVFNAHSRDKYITFFEEGHKYIVLFEPDVKYTSVTTWNHEHFSQFNADEVIKNMMKGKSWKEGHKYWGLSADQIKALWDNNKGSVSQAGTDLHYQIECFHNESSLQQLDYSNADLYELYLKKGNKFKNNSVEWDYFIHFVKDHSHLKPYRTEWIIYHEEARISGSIDMVYKNPDGTLSIYDWKRSKNITRINTFNKFAITPIICHLPDSNFWHYALQLNTYKYILEAKYGAKINGLFLVRLHPDAEEKNYELIELPDLQAEIHQLFEERIASL